MIFVIFTKKNCHYRHYFWQIVSHRVPQQLWSVFGIFLIFFKENFEKWGVADPPPLLWQMSEFFFKSSPSMCQVLWHLMVFWGIHWGISDIFLPKASSPCLCSLKPWWGYLGDNESGSNRPRQHPFTWGLWQPSWRTISVGKSFPGVNMNIYFRSKGISYDEWLILGIYYTIMHVNYINLGESVMLRKKKLV